ncbi:MAG: hypothetical protein OXB84_03850 [Halobacteriovoraceae bacterium]|nr:hypothetical protein [Halobacteriovoraceae bacterium]
MISQKIEKMYCPVCLNYTMELSKNGIIYLAMNNRRITKGKFFFNREKGYQNFIEGLHLALEEFYKLYSDFQNPQVIEHIELHSSDVVCKTGCSFDGSVKVSVIGILISKEDLWRAALEVGEKYYMEFKS